MFYNNCHAFAIVVNSDAAAHLVVFVDCHCLMSFGTIHNQKHIFFVKELAEVKHISSVLYSR